ncbi:Transmembrane protein [Trichinella pseudospiralis]|uniref:GDT1 family protein n=1 Tax=Trichinella pseudospiralis TaxID=6337 RepID=A0A0V1KC69_TRIPS|nr:Transmembrane protein [Trichinella pseudospiralis]KRZ44774.1 Transmembrane protein [Trichinella pseudospiralis]
MIMSENSMMLFYILLSCCSMLGCGLFITSVPWSSTPSPSPYVVGEAQLLNSTTASFVTFGDNLITYALTEIQSTLPPKSTTDSSSSFSHAFLASCSVVIVSEIGDKTFFIAATMAMKYSRIVVFSGALTALLLMTTLSAFLGSAVHLIPHHIVTYFSSALFAVFGLKMLRDAYYMTNNEAVEEFEEAQAEVSKLEATRNAKDLEAGKSFAPSICTGSAMCRFIGAIFIEAFVLTFLAEWGDRSQMATVILSASENITGVIVGGTFGHSLCTGMAVLCGRIVSQKLSVKGVTYIGGVIFLFFSLSSLMLNK